MSASLVADIENLTRVLMFIEFMTFVAKKR